MAMPVGSDGIAVRPVEEWANEKLHYLRRYVDVFTTAMQSKFSLAYIDLFAGPGRSVVQGTGREIDGSPLIALTAVRPFSQVYLNELEPESFAALRQRVGERPGVYVQNLDCNNAAREARQVIFPSGRSNGTLGLAFIDPTAFQLTYAALSEMVEGNRCDLVLTFMSSYVRRFLQEPNYEAVLDAAFGTPDWRRFIAQRSAGSVVTYRDFLDFYQERLRALGYVDVRDHVTVVNSLQATIYHLVFASKHRLGAEFWNKISQRRSDGQQRMDLGSQP